MHLKVLAVVTFGLRENPNYVLAPGGEGVSMYTRKTLQAARMSDCTPGFSTGFSFKKLSSPFRSASGGRRALVSFSTKFRGSGGRERGGFSKDF